MTKFQINADPKNIAQVEQFIEQLKTEHTISDDVYGNILISITEAVNNAIYHGAKGDKSKLITIEFINENAKKLIFFIKDNGSGFDYNALPDPTAPENLDKPCGRGIFLMRHLADLIVFSDNGATVELHFKL